MKLSHAFFHQTSTKLTKNRAQTPPNPSQPPPKSSQILPRCLPNTPKGTKIVPKSIPGACTQKLIWKNHPKTYSKNPPKMVQEPRKGYYPHKSLADSFPKSIHLMFILDPLTNFCRKCGFWKNGYFVPEKRRFFRCLASTNFPKPTKKDEKSIKK